MVMLVVSSYYHKCTLLPPQVIFIGTMHRTLPPNNEGKFMCINNGWDLTFSDNHWSTLETTKRFVHKIQLLYFHSQIKQLCLLKHLKIIWLLDYWSIHKNKEFIDWMKKYRLAILVIFIPTNYTSELQPLDVVLQQPLKHAFKVEFNTWSTSVIKY